MSKRNKECAEQPHGAQPLPKEKELAVDYAEPRKPVRRMLEYQIAAGLSEMERPVTGLWLAGLAAGLDVGFSLLLIAVTVSHARGVLPEPVVDLSVANMDAVGFIFVIFGHSQLFTEHTTLATLPVVTPLARCCWFGR